MKILMVHNFYQQAGGEDISLAVETAMLESRGHQVISFTAHNNAVKEMNRLAVAARTIWNPTSYGQLRRLIQRERPAIAHFQNTFPLISPAAYYAARAEGVPVVQALRNFRLVCPEGTLFRDGHICDQCVGKKIAWPSVVHGCYRKSRAGSAVTTAMLSAHRALGTWRNAVDVYIALTEAGRSRFIKGGLPAEKIMVKPNLVTPDPGIGRGSGGYAVYAGRLSSDKGIDVVLNAWKELGSLIPLKIIGEGELSSEVEAAAKALPAVQWLGRKSGAEVMELLGEAALALVPSRCNEAFGRVIVEAFARGTPVVASRVGAMPELIDHGRTGRLFTSGDSSSLTNEVRAMVEDKGQLAQARLDARREFDEKYTLDRNYELLMEIYAAAKRNSSPSAEAQDAVAEPATSKT